MLRFPNHSQNEHRQFPRRLFVIGISILLIVLPAIGYTRNASSSNALLTRTHSEKPYTFGVYLDNDADMLYRLSVFNVVVIDTTHFSADDLAWLKNSGTKIYSYTHIASAEKGTALYRKHKKRRLKKVAHTDARYYVQPKNKQWRNRLIKRMRTEAKKGITGFYLVDAESFAAVGKKKKQRVAEGHLATMKRIHKTFPKKKVIVENALPLFQSDTFQESKYKRYFEGIAQTELNYKPKYKAADDGRDTYKVANTKKKRKKLVKQLKSYKKKKIYTVDFTQSVSQKQTAAARARANGFKSFVGTRYLDNVLWYGGNTSSVTTRPFTNDSIWNTPISDSAPIDEHSAEMVNTLRDGISLNRIFVNVTEWTTPLYYVDSSMETESVACGNCAGGFGEPMAIPDWAQQDDTLDGLMTVVNVDTGYAYDMYQAEKQEDGTWYTRSGFKFNMKGSGVQPVDPTSSATRGAGFPLYAGLIRRDEILQGVIPHALVMAIDYPLAGYFVRPASHEDGRSTEEYGIPEGARIRIRPDVDVESLGLSRTGTIIAKALQDYGAFIGDNADGIAIYAEGRYAKEVGWEDPVDGSTLIDLNEITTIPFDTLEIMELGQMYSYE